MNPQQSERIPAIGEALAARGNPRWNESEFRRLLERLPVGAYTCDPDGLITYYNPSAELLWGRAPKLNDPVDRFCGSHRLLASDGTPLSHQQCWMARALETGEESNGEEIVIERPDGSLITVLAHASPIRDENSILLGAVNVLVDISDRKRAEEAHARLAAIVESSEDAIIGKTLDGTITSWNKGAERLYGYRADEILGSSIKRVIPPERQEEELAILARVRRGERLEHYESVRLSKQGRRIDVSLTISPVRNSSGRIIGASKIARDVSARSKADAALVGLKDELASQLADLSRLHELSVRLSTTLELRPILDETLRAAMAIEGAEKGLLSLCDADHGGLQVRASLGFGQEFLGAVAQWPVGAGACGTSYLERRRVVVEDVEIDPIFAPYREAARQGGFRAVHSTPLITRTDKIVGVLSTHFRRPHRPSDREFHLVDLCARQAVDFIENAQLYDQLREADRRKDEFLATLAHELRNPLAPIATSLDILQLSPDLTPADERIRSVIARHVGHLTRLVDDLLEISRITRGKIELRKERLDLADVLRAAVEAAQPAADAAGHQVVLELPPERIPFEGDPMRLAQVFGNLLQNAIKYTDRGGEIHVSARCASGQAVVLVRDSGIGIPPEMLPRVFDMFLQTGHSLGRSAGGLGIGLTLVRSLVAMHGGVVEARSEGPGQGSEFVVRLPLAAASFPITTVRSIPMKATPTDVTHRILVVDDNCDAANSLGRLLKIIGHEVEVVHDGQSALAVADAFAPSIVLLDLGMPHMDGFEVARRLRQNARTKSAALIALTGWGQAEARRRTTEIGFDHHLVKPVDVAALETLLDSLASPAVASPTAVKSPVANAQVASASAG